MKFLKYIEKRIYLPTVFRSWKLHKYLLLQQTKKAAGQLEKPCYVIIGFQIDRKYCSKKMSEFEHCKFTNIKFYLNSEVYSYDNLITSIRNNLPYYTKCPSISKKTF